MVLLGGIPFSGKTAGMDGNTFSLRIEHFDPSGIRMDLNRLLEISVWHRIIKAVVFDMKWKARQNVKL